MAAGFEEIRYNFVGMCAKYGDENLYLLAVCEQFMIGVIHLLHSCGKVQVTGRNRCNIEDIRFVFDKTYKLYIKYINVSR